MEFGACDAEFSDQNIAGFKRLSARGRKEQESGAAVEGV